VLYVRKKTPRFSLDQFDLPENSDAASVLFKDAKRERDFSSTCVYLALEFVTLKSVSVRHSSLSVHLRKSDFGFPLFKSVLGAV
jgi:hypothetical protein